MRGATIAILLTASAVAGQPAPDGSITPPLSPRNANYTISARLDAARHTISGSEVIVWRNVTTRAASDLQFHLYWNAWKSDRTTFMRERGLSGAARAMTDADRSRVDVTSLKLTAPSAVDLTGSTRAIAPDDGNADDETVLAVALPQPVPPGGSVPFISIANVMWVPCSWAPEFEKRLTEVFPLS